jgi:hypothetical protein
MISIKLFVAADISCSALPLTSFRLCNDISSFTRRGLGIGFRLEVNFGSNPFFDYLIVQEDCMIIYYNLDSYGQGFKLLAYAT